jgi:hypothetical protein
MIELSNIEKTAIEFTSRSYEPTIEITINYFLSNEVDIDIYNDLRKVLIEKIGGKIINERIGDICTSVIVLQLADRFGSVITD